MKELNNDKTAGTPTRRQRLTCVLSARSRLGQTQTAIVMESPFTTGKASYIVAPYRSLAQNAIGFSNGATTCWITLEGSMVIEMKAVSGQACLTKGKFNGIKMYTITTEKYVTRTR